MGENMNDDMWKNIGVILALTAGTLLCAIVFDLATAKKVPVKSDVVKYCDECECQCSSEGCLCVCNPCKCSNCGCPGCVQGN